MTSARALSSRCESAPSMVSNSPISSKRAIRSRRSSWVGPGLSLLVVARIGSGVLVSIEASLRLDVGGLRHLLPLLHLGLDDPLELLGRGARGRHALHGELLGH